MNVFKKIYCRVYQSVFYLLMPFLPYRKPKIYEDKPNFYKLVYGAQESYALYKFMYENTTNYLKRKKDIFEQAIEIKAGIGLTNCTRCGKEFVKTGKVQKYCRDCKKEVVRENDRKRYEKKKREKN